MFGNFCSYLSRLKVTKMQNDTRLRYRREIDGLRTIAVLPVIFFHAHFAGFSGGFIGVDVFFVISGYLITGIILSDLAEGKFSFRNFYERRIRRILPLLFSVSFTTFIAAFSFPC